YVPAAGNPEPYPHDVLAHKRTLHKRDLRGLRVDELGELFPRQLLVPILSRLAPSARAIQLVVKVFVHRAVGLPWHRMPACVVQTCFIVDPWKVGPLGAEVLDYRGACRSAHRQAGNT